MDAYLSLINEPTRYMFFTGKGGVGKTSLSAATAVALADRGQRVLLVSTDPASNLDAVLGESLSQQPKTIPGLERLAALNIDPEAAADEYRHRVIDPYRGVLPDDAIRQMEEQLAGACTTEIAAFDRFTALLNGHDAFDHILFDTAPTGHTLRLLNLPAAWDGYLAANTTGTSCVGPVSGLRTQKESYSAAVAALTDAMRTTVVIVARAEESAIQEALRTSRELGGVGMTNQHLVMNAVFESQPEGDLLAAAVRRRTAGVLREMPPELAALPSDTVALKPFEPMGIEFLRHLLAPDGLSAIAADRAGHSIIDLPGSDSLVDLADELAAAGHGLVMVMGKGGVGKTTIAAAIAVEIARRGSPVHLTTTDPAAHISFSLPEDVPGIRISRIDPRVETQAYVDHVLATSGAGLDERGRALLEEDLRSPCTEEIAVFNAFSRTLREARRGIVVLDTAPTGHTLLLLDATGAYHREIMRSRKNAARFTTPLMMLQDRSLTRILIVTLPETTPIQEAHSLQQDLRRAGIEPEGWVLNRSLAAAAPSHPVLRARAAAELPRIQKLRRELPGKLTILPWSGTDPVGAIPLLELIGSSNEAIGHRS